MNFNTPILFIIFKRVDTTYRVFEMIKKIKPKQLFIYSDGPRKNRDEEKLVQKNRDIVKQVDWECEVKTLFLDDNKGPKLAISSAVNWFFKNVDQGIILEHDCLPNISFFYFCEELLEKYKDDKRIMHIGGNNWQKQTNYNNSYYFSAIPHIWGWATWKRAWQYYDIQMSDYPEFVKENKIEKIFTRKIAQKFWLEVFNKYYQGGKDTWDFQWVYTLFKKNGLAITPQVNLVSNIGFGSDAVHASSENHKLANRPTKEIKFPLIHPQNMVIDRQADDYTDKYVFGATYTNYGIKKVLKKIGLFNLVKNIYLKFKK